jgi:serine/threonine protein kinase
VPCRYCRPSHAPRGVGVLQRTLCFIYIARIVVSHAVSAEISGNGLDVTLRDFTGGEKLFNRYRLTRTLGRGGMGIVWLARDEELERDVALKFLPQLIIHDRAVLGDLKRETRRSLELTHKNIVRIYDFVHDNTSGCISMEYVDGDTLSNLRADKSQKVFETYELADWISELCDALHYAHDHARIVHRDLKPANLMVNQRGDLKVTDFGIARSLSDSVSKLTMQQGKSGTLVYMSPQQLEGERGTPLDDIYSVGASIYELLTSRPPFYSGNLDRQIREKVPPPIMQRRKELEIEGEPIDANWEQVVRACVAKDPKRRPQSVSEIADRLELPLPGTRRTTRSEHTGRKQVRKRGATSWGKSLSLGFKLVVSVGLVALAAAVAWFFVRQSTAPTSPANASQQTPASATSASTIEAKPSPAMAPALPTAVAALPSPAPSVPPTKAILELSTLPAGAKVFQNGTLIGITPIRRDDLEPGDTTLVLIKDGYLPRELRVALNTSSVFNRQISLAQSAPLYHGMIRVRNKNAAPAVPVSIALAPDSKSGTMTQTGRHGNFVVKFTGVWDGAELHAVSSEVLSQPSGIQWTPESFALRFADDGKSAAYECVAGGSTYVAELAAQSGAKTEVGALYKGTIRKQGDSTGRGVPLTITFAPDRNSGTETQGSKYGDTIVNFSGIWDGKTLRAVTSTIVSKPKNIQWKPESFALSFADDWRTGTYDCTAEGQRFIAELSAQ